MGGWANRTPNPYRFGAAWGYITDPSGFLQLGRRDYWPEVGRFITQDPIGKGMNWYAYVGSNPLVFVDPTGERIYVPRIYVPWEDPTNTGATGVVVGLDKAQNYVAGIGDKVSWGISRRIRAGMGPDRVDPCSGWYMAGEVTGIGLTAVAGGAVVREAGAWAAGRGWVEVTRWGAPGKWVMRGGPLRVNYWAARIPSQPPLSSSTWVSVPRSLLRWPGAADEGGWLFGTWKGLWGHRVFMGTPFGY